MFFLQIYRKNNKKNEASLVTVLSMVTLYFTGLTVLKPVIALLFCDTL